MEEKKFSETESHGPKHNRNEVWQINNEYLIKSQYHSRYDYPKDNRGASGFKIYGKLFQEWVMQEATLILIYVYTYIKVSWFKETSVEM